MGNNQPVFANSKGELYQLPIKFPIKKVVIAQLGNYELAKAVADSLNAEMEARAGGMVAIGAKERRDDSKRSL